jgi:hypothetical protein
VDAKGEHAGDGSEDGGSLHLCGVGLWIWFACVRSVKGCLSGNGEEKDCQHPNQGRSFIDVFGGQRPHLDWLVEEGFRCMTSDITHQLFLRVCVALYGMLSGLFTALSPCSSQTDYS